MEVMNKPTLVRKNSWNHFEGTYSWRVFSHLEHCEAMRRLLRAKCQNSEYRSCFGELALLRRAKCWERNVQSARQHTGQKVIEAMVCQLWFDAKPQIYGFGLVCTMQCLFICPMRPYEDLFWFCTKLYKEWHYRAPGSSHFFGRFGLLGRMENFWNDQISAKVCYFFGWFFQLFDYKIYRQSKKQ